MIHLAIDTSDVRLDLGREAICVRHRTFDPPQTGPECEHVTSDEYLRAPRMLTKGRSVLVLVGLNKIITPGNRTKVGPYLLRPQAGLRRVSVDQTLFVSEPWRAWFHFGLVGVPYREYTYSYLAESHWRSHREGVRADDPFSRSAILECGRGSVRSHYRHFFKDVDIERVEVGADDRRRYAELKSKCFDEEHTAPRVIRRLAAFAAEVLPGRSLPTRAQLFRKRQHRFVVTDLAVDTWLLDELTHLVRLTNGISEAFHAEHTGQRSRRLNASSPCL